ncbi:tetratricopeptide repeat protein [Pseudomonas viridiflava]|uniref:Tetratricopeptide repeat protein n=1 Tax=Pseudomonas viridiflava TaxID=33069 RepID=A0A1Y6JUN7_PSEVI|nr:tetratricopeptide repeat protein [Pseudomonas viridiflava]UZA71556.1 tetratricopeptide repeat protein [Pseudomonas viridiflava]WKW33126.1 tetratricopeptide repeat protein [Pseudomonas viridiflava]SMS12850.1 hypothetical protein CFBP1590__5264 [Pseudomonas viridiflava]VVO22014.1 hypothetical protein PS689_04311 [Pseudomonas fluorescens]
MISKKTLFAVVFTFVSSASAEADKVVCDPDSHLCSIQIDKNYCDDGEIATSRWDILSGEYVLSCECDCTAQENRFWIISPSGGVKSLEASKVTNSVDLVKHKKGVSDTFGVVPFCSAMLSRSNGFIFLEKTPSNAYVSAPYCYSLIKKDSAGTCQSETCIDKEKIVTDFAKKYNEQFLTEFKNATSRLYKENARFADFPKRSFVKLYLDKYGFSKNNQQILNDTAYFWQQANYNGDAIWLLEKIIDNNPERVVAYLNLADAYWSEGEKQAAQKNYNTYVSIMIQQGRQQKIPSRVMERYDPRW